MVRFGYGESWAKTGLVGANGDVFKSIRRLEGREGLYTLLHACIVAVVCALPMAYVVNVAFLRVQFGLYHFLTVRGVLFLNSSKILLEH